MKRCMISHRQRQFKQRLDMKTGLSSLNASSHIERANNILLSLTPCPKSLRRFLAPAEIRNVPLQRTEVLAAANCIAVIGVLALKSESTSQAVVWRGRFLYGTLIGHQYAHGHCHHCTRWKEGFLASFVSHGPITQVQESAHISQKITRCNSYFHTLTQTTATVPV